MIPMVRPQYDPLTPGTPLPGLRTGGFLGMRSKVAVGAVAGILLLALQSLQAADGTQPRPVLALSNPRAALEIDLLGGAIGAFRLQGNSLNPFDWNSPASDNRRPHAFGHFLCLDRWGPPSDAEGANGMPYHGEATHVPWEVATPTKTTPEGDIAVLTAVLPKAGLAIERTVRISPKDPFVFIQERVTNRNPLGRMYNIVQHPTIGGSFLTTNTVVDCNGRRGFAQGNPLPHPEEPTFHWPSALTAEGERVDIRHLHANPNPNVVSYAIDASIGWVTAATPERGLLLGYVWRTQDYPWVSHWRDVNGGKPSARGLEFGSTGLHQPFPVLAKVGSVWDRAVFQYLDAAETQTRAYGIFLLEIPQDFGGVDRVEIVSNQFILTERARGKPREWRLESPRELTR